MIVVDSSAIAAVILREEDQLDYARVLASDMTAIATPTLVELQIVLARRQVANTEMIIRQILVDTEMKILPFGQHMVELAWNAYMEFGKGRHPAKLNFGDCMAYAVAKSLDAPLLYKGNDFAQTDIRSALG